MRGRKDSSIGSKKVDNNKLTAEIEKKVCFEDNKRKSNEKRNTNCVNKDDKSKYFDSFQTRHKKEDEKEKSYSPVIEARANTILQDVNQALQNVSNNLNNFEKHTDIMVKRNENERNNPPKLSLCQKIFSRLSMKSLEPKEEARDDDFYGSRYSRGNVNLFSQISTCSTIETFEKDKYFIGIESFSTNGMRQGNTSVEMDEKESYLLETMGSFSTTMGSLTGDEELNLHSKKFLSEARSHWIYDAICFSSNIISQGGSGSVAKAKNAAFEIIYSSLLRGENFSDNDSNKEGAHNIAGMILTGIYAGIEKEKIAVFILGMMDSMGYIEYQSKALMEDDKSIL